MDLGLKGKIALVSGASKGLGLAVAKGLAREGATLVISSRDEEVLKQRADEMKNEFGADVFYGVTDLLKPGSAKEFAEKVIDKYGGVDILVTNSGGPLPGAFEEFGESEWRKATELLLFSAQAYVRAFLPGMKKKNWGRIIAMTSISVKQPVQGLMLSNSIRAAVVGFVKTLADEVAQSGINVNSVGPGWILTERVDQLLEHLAEKKGITKEEARKRIIDAIPVGRMGTPEEFADLVVFLASERSSFITGSTYLIDGGMYRGYA